MLTVMSVAAVNPPAPAPQEGGMVPIRELEASVTEVSPRRVDQAGGREPVSELD